MKNLLKAGCLCALALAAPGALALGLGNLRVSSLQGAPLEAEVDVLASLEQMEAAWTVELLPDQSGDQSLAPEVFASLAGTLQRAPDGSLFVELRSTEPIPDAEISFRLRLASSKEALVARMAGTPLPLPKPPQMAERMPRTRAAAEPAVAAPAVIPVPRMPAVEASPQMGDVASGAGLSGTAAAVAAPAPDSASAVEASAPPANVGSSPSGATAVAPDAAEVASGAPPDQQAEPSAAAQPAPLSALAEAPAAKPPAQTAAVAPPPPVDPDAGAASWTDLVDFSTPQALAVAGGLAVLVVLLVMRRRLASIVVSSLSALRDETLKAQMASKLQAQAAQKAQAASARAAREEPAPRPEADLNAEIDVLLAYAEYGKAEERLQAALREAPNNIQARLRLAELRYITEDSAGFVELVEQIQLHHRGELTDEQWQKLTRMGKVVAPDAAPFAGPRAVQRDVS